LAGVSVRLPAFADFSGAMELEMALDLFDCAAMTPRTAREADGVCRQL
jgi:hypothetical protein